MLDLFSIENMDIFPLLSNRGNDNRLAFRPFFRPIEDETKVTKKFGYFKNNKKEGHHCNQGQRTSSIAF